ncbi:MAG: O-antigen ligase family protein, partial [Chromatiales bacterium]|nr:O-antigen ligase family protein [Chromatiales bacterium]
MNQPDAIREESSAPRSERVLALQGAFSGDDPMPRLPRAALLIAALLFAFPLFAISLKHWVSTIYALVGFISLVAIVATRSDARPLQAQEKLFLGIIVFYVVVTLIANTLSGWTKASIGWYEADIRFMFAIPIFLFLRRYPSIALYLLRVAPVAGMLAGAYVIYEFQMHHARVEGPYGPIFAGNIAALLAVISLAALRYDTYPPRVKLFVHFFGIALALAAAMLSGTRSAWLAVLVAMPVVLYFLVEGRNALRFRRYLVSAIVVIVIGTIITTVEFAPRLIQHRSAIAIQETESYLLAQTDAERAEAANSSVGIRFEQ